MTFLAASILERAGETLGDYLPRLGGAVAVLVVGIVLVRLLARGLRGLLTRVGVDALAERGGVHDVLARAGLKRSLNRVVAAAVRVALTIAVVLAALSLLGLGPLDEAINEAALFLPNVLAALALVLAGAVLGSFAGRARARGHEPVLVTRGEPCRSSLCERSTGERHAWLAT